MYGYSKEECWSFYHPGGRILYVAGQREIDQELDSQHQIICLPELCNDQHITYADTQRHSPLKMTILSEFSPVFVSQITILTIVAVCTLNHELNVLPNVFSC